jgi:hypothetical protein
MHIASIGIDLGKNTFHLVALGDRNKVLLGKKFSRAQLLAYTANLPILFDRSGGMSGAHGLASVLRGQGHQVRLIPGRFVKPYRKSNKNDFLDTEAIAEAVTKGEYALRADQDRGAVGCASHAPRPRSTSTASHRPDQRDSRIPAGTRHQLCGATDPSSQKSARGHRRPFREHGFGFVGNGNFPKMFCRYSNPRSSKD